MFSKSTIFLFLSSFFALCSFFSYTYASDNQKPYDMAIGLGDRCQVAYQLRQHGYQKKAFPFDWLLTPTNSLCNFVLHRAKDFMEIENLRFYNDSFSYTCKEASFVRDLVYNLEFLHDFTLQPDYLKDYDSIKAKYDRRIARFFKVLQSNKKILFVRYHMTKVEATILDHILHSHYPHLDYTLLVLDDTDEVKSDWGLERIQTRYLRQLVPWQWSGDTSAWSEILAQFPIHSK